MTQRRLLLILVMTSTFNVAIPQQPLPTSNTDCDHCNENGRWWPLFKPSQIISSEFLEHKAHNSENKNTYDSEEQESCNSKNNGVSRNAQEITSLNLKDDSGIDTQVKKYKNNGKSFIEWNHYGDTEHVTTVIPNNLDDRSGSFHDTVEAESNNDITPHSLEAAITSDEEMKSGNKQELNNKYEEPIHDVSKSNEETFFTDGSFFEETQIPTSNEESSGKFGESTISGESSFFDKTSEKFSNSFELVHPKEKFEIFKKPVATSYSSISSIFRSRRIPQSTGFLHPYYKQNYIKHDVNRLPQIPLSQTMLFNRHNMTKQYLVQEKLTDNPGAFHIKHVAHERNSQPLSTGFVNHTPPPYVPRAHPVYRYVRLHGGLNHLYQQQPPSQNSYQIQDFQNQKHKPLKKYRPAVHVQNHAAFVHHVIPTRDPFSDNFWKESRKQEIVQLPSEGKILYLIKKKPKSLNFKIRRRVKQIYI